MSILDSLADTLFPQRTKVLQGEKALAVIEGWQRESRGISVERKQIENVVPKMESRLEEIQKNIEFCESDIADATDTFKKAKSIEEKKYAARKLVYSTQLKSYLIDSKMTMSATVEESKHMIEDASRAVAMLQQKARDAELYYQLNQQITMMGKMVSATDKITLRAKEITTNFKATSRDFGEVISKVDGDDIINQAEQLIKHS